MIIYWDTLEKDASDSSTIPEYIASEYMTSVKFARNIYWENQKQESGKNKTIPEYIYTQIPVWTPQPAPTYWESLNQKSGSSIKLYDYFSNPSKTEYLTNKTLDYPKINYGEFIGGGGVKTFSKQYTRDAAAASGSVQYTGVPFKPTAMIIVAVLAATTIMSIIHVDENKTCLGINCTGNNTFRSATGYTVIDSDAVANYQVATMTSFDNNGCTFQWEKGGSPTGTIYINILYIR